MQLLIRLFKHRFGAVILMFLLVIGISTLTRLGLFIWALPVAGFSLTKMLAAFAIGFVYDVVVAIFFSTALILYTTFMPDKWFRSRFGTIFLYVYFFLSIIILLFNAVSEFTFWNEFSVRYNFIAVDYLIYTTEVIENIWQSYPMPVILGGLLVAVILIFWLVKKYIPLCQQQVYRFKQRWYWGIGLLLLGLLNFFIMSDKYRNFSSDRYYNELAGNGMFQFGSAFRTNVIDYKEFYASRNDETVFNTVKELLKTPNATFTGNNLYDIERNVQPDSPLNKWNVVLISIESLSAEYLEYFGTDRSYVIDRIGYKGPITPVLDSLVHEAVFFKNLYATGTRTVRGLECLSLSIPPTPGQSIVKRLPTMDGLFTIGSVLRERGYDTKYIYGGNSFFDNMGDYFAKNGYHVVDEDAIPADSIHHKTAWGVCDEDLYTLGLKQMDQAYANNQLFFHHLMTVSNHRPYTYPENRVDISPKLKFRPGAMQYTDYCVGKLLREAKTKPWFNNTIFVIVADHCANSAGKSDLPLNGYHIPCWIYAPALLKPQLVERLTSQIDLAPTILGLLNVPYQSKFYGYDIFKLEPGRERLFVVNYQDVGYVKDGKMVILSPQKRIHMVKPDFKTGEAVEIPLEEKMVNEAISYFQSASYLVEHKLYNEIKRNITAQR